ncbi:glycosyltransferase [Roseateles sp. SL47]|uniref:glycosyltransferase n=1 Tax=Roseateles sp. SL47 TaxID=2995138 RepID=UPI0022717F48|nr:glycosyltransferase [Roseateles sp. SL47]WAC72190.1 glycosyltransferase [Roseateles sp. SL47]
MPNLIVFSHLRWGFVYQRPQHLMSRIASAYQVLFIEEPVLDRNGPARIESRMESPPGGGPAVEVLVPYTPVNAPGFDDAQLPTLLPLLEQALNQRSVRDYLVWLYTPMALPLIAGLHPRALVYDCMDELSAFKHAPPQLRQRENALMQAADLVLCGGPALHQAKRKLHPRVYCLPSAVDAAHFSPDHLDATHPQATHAEQVQAGIAHPRLGFFGVIDERMDLALLDAVAAARPDWQMVMVGPVVKISPEDLPRRSNLHWLGMQSYQALPYLLSTWNVCLMPFALNESTRFISPTKTLEYLAGEKPVVSTPVADVVGLYGAVVRIAAEPDAFIRQCEDALQDSAELRRRHIQASMAVVAASGWDASAEKVRRWLAEVSRPAQTQTPMVRTRLRAA